MKDKGSTTILLLLATLVLANLLVFIIPFSRGVVFWIAYAFLMVAIVAYFAMKYFIGKKTDVLREKISQYPLLRIGTIYIVIQIIVSIVFFIADAFLSPVFFWIPLVLCLVVTVLACVLFAKSYSSLETVKEIQDTETINTAFVNSLTVEVDLLRKRVSDPEMQKKLTQFCEMVRYSDPVSSSGLATIEQNISDQVLLLKSTLSDGDFVQAEKILQELTYLMDERNQKCKLLK